MMDHKQFERCKSSFENETKQTSEEDGHTQQTSSKAYVVPQSENSFVKNESWVFINRMQYDYKYGMKKISPLS